MVLEDGEHHGPEAASELRLGKDLAQRGGAEKQLGMEQGTWVARSWSPIAPSLTSSSATAPEASATGVAGNYFASEDEPAPIRCHRQRMRSEKGHMRACWELVGADIHTWAKSWDT